MNSREYDLVHRNYYFDHPISLSHREPYITPLDNQYTALNRSRNPYHVLDHLNFEVSRQPKSAAPPIYKNQTLENEIRVWDRRQAEKENAYRQLKNQLKDLNRELRHKQKEYEREQMRNQFRQLASNQSRIMPFPMMFPMQAMGNCFLNGYDRGCQCRCHCNCSSNFSCQTSNTYIQPKPTKQYKHIITQNVETIAPPSPSVPIEKKPPSPAKTSLVSIRSQPKISPQQAMALKKKKKSNLLRRFRKCAYAVYFCIYFKWFSFQFSLNRYNRFKLKYLVDSGKQITDAYRQVYQKLLNIDISRLIRTAAGNVPEKKQGDLIDVTTLLKPEAVPKYQNLRNMKLLSRNSETLFGRCGEFISMLFEEIEGVFGEWEWGELGNALGIGAVNLSYMIDSYFLPHELYLMTFHDGKGYAQISPQHELIQVMIKIIVKMLLFNVCLQLDNNREWLQKHQQQLEDAGDKDEIFIFLEISAKIIFITCQHLYQAQLKGHDTNYDEVSDRFKVDPCNPLIYSHSIRKRRQLFKEENVRDSNLLIYGLERLDEVNQIMQQPFFTEEKGRVIASINSVIEQIVSKLQESKRELFKQVWEETLDNEYIVLRGLKKVMKSTRHYPFFSGSVILSKNSLASNKSVEQDKNNRSLVDSINQNKGEESGMVSKTSILQRRGRRK